MWISVYFAAKQISSHQFHLLEDHLYLQALAVQPALFLTNHDNVGILTFLSKIKPLQSFHLSAAVFHQTVPYVILCKIFLSRDIFSEEDTLIVPDASTIVYGDDDLDLIDATEAWDKFVPSSQSESQYSSSQKTDPDCHYYAQECEC